MSKPNYWEGYPRQSDVDKARRTLREAAVSTGADPEPSMCNGTVTVNGCAKCGAYEARAQGGPSVMHEHEWQPAGVTEAGDGRFALVFGMCKCGEITIRQWDY